MNTKNTSFNYASTHYFDAPKPINCPHCGAYVEASILNITGYNYFGSHFAYLVTFIGNCCRKHFFGLYDSENKIATLLQLHPQEKQKEFPECINLISPRFVETYNQAYFAEQNSFLELAGAGYRNSLEILIKDFAINELQKPKEEVCKKKLYDAIGEYTPNIRIANSADVVRVLGNDYTHYERKYEAIEFEILKRYLHIFVQSIENEYLLNHPIVPINR